MTLKMQYRRKLPFRLKKNHFEQIAWQKGLFICGIDEVGRGCLVGPVVTAAVVLPHHTSYRNLKDSKVLTESERLLAYKWIKSHCWYGIGIIHHRLIDKHNIWQATLLGMKRAFIQLSATFPYTLEEIITDAMPLHLWDTAFTHIPVHYFPKAEALSASVAAASIIAKVTRDELIKRIDPLFPGYYLAQHKGYGTLQHKKALQQQDRTIIHRTSFLKHIEVYNKKLTYQQSNFLV
jgi:ribonuclease HII